MEKKTGFFSDKIRVYLVGILAALVILTSLLWGSMSLVKGELSNLVFPGIIALLVLVFMVSFVKRRYFDVKAGFPFEDERSKKVLNRAFAQAYVLSIYWLLVLAWASDGIIDFRDVSQAMGMGIVGMAVLFGLCYLYYNRKGDVE